MGDRKLFHVSRERRVTLFTNGFSNLPQFRFNFSTKKTKVLNFNYYWRRLVHYLFIKKRKKKERKERERECV